MSDRGTGFISGTVGTPTTTLTWSTTIGKRIREGTWQEQAVSTVERIEEAIAAGQREVAAELVDYFMEEAKVCHAVYQVWVDGFGDWLLGRGVTPEELAAERRRLDELLRFPDGAPFEPHGRWSALGAQAGRLANDLRGLQLPLDEAPARLGELREAWRQLHDRWADLQSGLLTYVARRFGEAAIGDCYRAVLEPFLEERYGPFDLRERPYEETIERNLYLAFEAMRAHLSGPDRLGNLTVTEDEDKWVIAFDPCGSGNRGQRGDAIEGTPSRSEPPYEFGVTTEEHDWAWNERGVCYYCAHCCLTNELWAVERWGAPVRVVDSPLHPDETLGPDPRPCTWTVYKSIAAIPEEAYRRIGRTKGTAPGGSSASGG
jgi:hypothetical protein